MGQIQDSVHRSFARDFQIIKQNCLYSKILNIPDFMYAPIVAAKRSGQYEKASHMYAELAQSYNAFSPQIAKSWFKVLAVAGCFNDALELATYTLNCTPKKDVNIAVECLKTGNRPDNQYIANVATIFADSFNMHSALQKNDGNALVRMLRGWCGNPGYSFEDIFR